MSVVDEPRTWRRVWAQPAMRDTATIDLCAQRSDEVCFHVTCRFVPTDDPVQTLLKAVLLLDEFRTCACVVGTPCEKHTFQDWPGAGEGGAKTP